MDITQQHLDLFKQHFPGDERIQSLDLVEVRAQAAAAPSAWHDVNLDEGRTGEGLPSASPSMFEVTACQMAAGTVVLDVVLLILPGGGAIRSGVKPATVRRIAQIVAEHARELSEIEELIAKIASKGSSRFAKGKAMVSIATIIRDASMLPAIVAAITDSLSWWSAVLFGIGAIATIIGAVATDGGVLLAVALVNGAIDLVWLGVDIDDAVTKCGLTPIPDTTQEPQVPQGPNPCPYEPRFALRTSRGYLLSVVNGGGLGRAGVAIATDSTTVTDNEVFTLVPVVAVAKTFALRTAGGRYVTAVGGGGMGGPDDASTPIHTETTLMRSWERLKPIQQGSDDKLALATPENDYYLSAVGGGGVGPDSSVPINTSATTIGADETFSFLPASPNGPAAVLWITQDGEGSEWGLDPAVTRVRVYSQVPDGRLCELSWASNSSWSVIPLEASPTPQTGLAAIQWTDDGGPHLRVVYQDREDQLCMTGYDPDADQWWSSVLTTTAGVAPGTSVAAVCWRDATGDHIRVYYQDASDVVCEIGWNTTTWWTAPARLIPGAPGTALAALSRVDSAGVHLEVFSQDTRGVVNRLAWDPGTGWAPAQALFPAIAATGLAATQWADDGTLRKRVYFQGAGSVLTERAYDQETGWNAGSSLETLTTECGLAAVRWSDSGGIHLRSFWNADGTVFMKAFDPRTGWVPPTALPTLPPL